jgi:clan AA aspartic protease (TIGR02281 family)
LEAASRTLGRGISALVHPLYRCTVKPIRLRLHQFVTSCHPLVSFLHRGMTLKLATARLSSPILAGISVVIILVGSLAMSGAGRTGVRDSWGDTHGQCRHTDRSMPAYVLEMSQLGDVLFAAVQPGRLGVTEQPGRRGVADQDGRSGADPDQAARDPMPQGGRPRPIIVEALLNRQVSVPLLLDTGATYTVLTRQTASDLGITSLARLPKHSFLTAGGPIQSPVTTLKSIRVGTVEAQNVAVAIDADGHLPLGLLGMTFMRHFKVTVDQAQGQAKFEQR